MTQQGKPVVGFIGLGSIGKPMAERIAGNGYKLVVHDTNPAAVAALQVPAEQAKNAIDVASRADVVFSCLVTADSHRAVVGGPDGIVGGTRAKLYVHLGTTGAALVAELEAKLARAGIAVLDSPMTGGVPAARAGTLMVMASGAPAAFAEAEPILCSYAKKIAYLGEKPGMAQTMKVVNNMIALANLAVAAEAVVIGVKAGLKPTDMLEVLNGGSAQSSVTSVKLPHYILPRKFNFGGAMDVVVKDIQLFLEEAAGAGLDTPLGHAVHQAFTRAMESVGAKTDLTTIILPHENAAGVKFAVNPLG